MRIYLILISLLSALISESEAQQRDTVYSSENFLIIRTSKSSYQHISFLETEAFGMVPCNGMVVTSDGKAVVFDTPVNDETSIELIDFVEKTLKCTIEGIVINHFHNDCLGGLKVFHEKGIISHASNKTVELAREHGVEVPRLGFEKQMALRVGNVTIINFFPGEGHSPDNVVSYFPADRVLFGGCLIKAKGSGKGNLADANISAWPESVKKVKNEFGYAKIVIPGHGDAGGRELLDYTINLFESD